MEDTYEYKEIGLPMEIMAQNIIKKAYGVDIIETCNNADFDFKDSNHITYEIKADRKSSSTDNFFITYGQKTLANTELQPAGISKSKADYHMLMYGESFYKIKTADIRLLIFKNTYHKLTCRNARKEEIHGLISKKYITLLLDFPQEGILHNTTGILRNKTDLEFPENQDKKQHMLKSI